MDGPGRGRRATGAWILYDLANTTFSFNILSAFFPVWLNQDLRLPDSVFALGNALSMLLVALLAPGFGLLTDRARRRIPFLIGSTVACVLPTALLGFAPWPLAITLFVVANAGFQLGLVAYDALLPYVSTPENRGRVAGWGVGVGYGGSLLALVVGRSILDGHEERDAWVFLATALLFLTLALPAFLFIREPRVDGGHARPSVSLAIVDGLRGVRRLVTTAESADLRRFFLGRLLYADAANTMIIFMGVYAVTEAGFDEAGVALVLATGIIGALVLSPATGLLVDRAGPKRALDVALLMWMFCLAMVALVGLLHLPRAVFYPVAFLLGGTLGSTWTSDRPLLVALAPPDRVGDLFGVYAMVGRFGAVLGPLLWALIVDGLHWGRAAAVLGLLGFVLAGFLILRPLAEPVRRERNPLGAFLPWRDAQGFPRPRPPRWARRFPATLTYALATTILFVVFWKQYGALSENAPAWLVRLFVYRIPELFTNVPLTLLHFVTGVWVNWHIVQLVYVLVLLALFGMWFEVREGTRRAVLVFYATSLTAGVVAGLALYAIRAFASAPWIDAAWTQAWTGGSAGAFGLMGATAARARRPWLLLVLFGFWELNVGYWWLRSYTPAFHITAMLTGFLLARYALRPRAAA